MGMSFTDEDLHYVTNLNNLLHSISPTLEWILTINMFTTQIISTDTRLQFPINLRPPQKL